MARTALTVVESTKAGTLLPAGATADVANGNVVNGNDGRVIVLAQNTNGASTARTVTITVTGAIDGFAPAPRTVSVAAGTTKTLGPYDTTAYSTALQISGDHAELKFQVIRIPG